MEENTSNLSEKEVPKKKRSGKNTIVTILAIIICGGAAFGIITFFKKPAASIQGIYLVPDNAVIIIETSDPMKSWADIYNNSAWKTLRTNKYLETIDTSLASLDSLASKSKLLSKITDKRTIYASLHKVGYDDYEMMITLDLKGLSNLAKMDKALLSLLGKNYEITRRKVKEFDIIEIFDKEEQEFIYLAFIENQAIVSFHSKLIEKALEQFHKPIIGRDDKFIEVHKRVTGKDMFRLYVNYSIFSEIQSESEKQEDFYNYIAKSLCYSGFSFDLNPKGQIKLAGNTSLNDTVYSYFKAFYDSENGPLKSSLVIPQRTSFFLNLSFDNFEQFYENIQKSMKNNPEEYEDVQETIGKIEKKLDINLREDFFSWINDEIVVMQVQPVLTHKEIEYAAILKANSGRDAQKKMDHLVKQVKKNTPAIKFKDIDYKGYKISYLHIPGLFKALFGKLLDKLEKPYFAVVNDYVIFSNHPQTLKSIIDDYMKNKTLANDDDYKQFIGNFARQSNVFVFINSVRMYNNLPKIVGKDTWTKIEENKEYLMLFPRIGFQMINQDELFNTKLLVDYDPEAETAILEQIKKDEAGFEEIPDTYIEEEDEETNEENGEVDIPESNPDTIIASVVHIDDLDANKHEEFFEDGQLKLFVEISKGLKNGDFKEYYPSGDIKVKGKFKDDQKDGKWKYFDLKGKIVKEEVFEAGEIVK